MRLSRQGQHGVLLGCVAAVSLWLLYESYFFEEEFGIAATTYGPAFFQRILIGLILLLCIALAWKNWKAASVTVASGTLPPGGTLRIAGTVAACILFALLWEYCGFLAGAFAFAAAMSVLLRPSPAIIAVIAAFIPAAWYFFARILMVQF